MKNRLAKIIRKPISARTYGAVFLLVAASLFAVFGFKMTTKIKSVNTIAQQQNTKVSEQELKQSIDFTLKRTVKDMQKLVNWDEVHHQINEPVYYAYWRSDRIKSSNILPSYISAVELYNKNKKILLRDATNELPPNIPEAMHEFKIISGKLYLHRFSSVKSRKPSSETIGYIGAKIDFLKALDQLSNFVYTNPESITVKSGIGKQFTINSINILSLLNFKPKKSFSSNEQEVVMYQFLKLGGVLLLLMFMLFYFVIKVLFTKPLEQLVAHIDLLRQGRSSDLTNNRPVFHLQEIASLHISLNTYQAELDELHDMLDKRNTELQTMTRIDPLTGIYNRRAFDDDWDSLKMLVKGKRLEIAFLLFDCDNFKAINDTYGHDAGDQVIQIMAKELSNVLRKGDKLYRIGGDEFAAFLMNTSDNSANMVAARCIDCLQPNPFKSLGLPEPVSISIGYAVASATEADSIDDLPKNADKAMYIAKESGEQKIICYNKIVSNN